LACFKFSQKLVDKVAKWQEGKTEKWQEGKVARRQFLFSRLAVLPFSHLAILPNYHPPKCNNPLAPFSKGDYFLKHSEIKGI